MEPNSELLLKLRHRRTRMGEEASLADIVNTMPDQDVGQSLDLPTDVKVKQRRIVFEGSENRSANRKDSPPMKLCKLEDALGDLPGELYVSKDLPQVSPSPTRRVRFGEGPGSCSPSSQCKSNSKASPGHAVTPGAKQEDAQQSPPQFDACLPTMELGRKVMEAICEEPMSADAKDSSASHFSLLGSLQDDKAPSSKLETSTTSSNLLDESGEAEPLEYAALDFFHSLPAEFVLKLKGNLESNEKEIRHLRRENRQLRELFERKANTEKKSSSSSSGEQAAKTPQKGDIEVFEDHPSVSSQHAPGSSSPQEAVERSVLAEVRSPSSSKVERRTDGTPARVSSLKKAIERERENGTPARSPVRSPARSPTLSPKKVAHQADTPARSSSPPQVAKRVETPAGSSSPKQVAKRVETPRRSSSPMQVAKRVETPARSSSPKQAADEVGPVTVWLPRKVAALEVGVSNRPVPVKSATLPATPGFSPPVPPLGPPRANVQTVASVATAARQVIVQPPQCITPMHPPSATHLGSPPQRRVQTPQAGSIVVHSPPTASPCICTPPPQNLQLPTWRAAPPVSSRTLSFEAAVTPTLDAGEVTKLRARAERAEVSTAQAQISQLSDALRAANEKRQRQDVERWALLHEAMRELSRQPEPNRQRDYAASPEPGGCSGTPWRIGTGARQGSLRTSCRSSSADTDARRNTPMRSPSANRQARAHMVGPSRSPSRGDKRTQASPLRRSPGPKRNAGPRRSLSAGARPTNQPNRSSSRSSVGVGRNRIGTR